MSQSQIQSPPPGMLLDFLAQRGRYYPIYTSLSSYLGIGEIVALTRTCKKLSHLYQEFLPTRWNIDHDLARFVEDPWGFRTQLGRHNAFVSGDFAHCFFKGDTWKISNMDVFIKYGDGSKAFVQYLFEREGYEIESSTGSFVVHAWDCTYVLNRKNTHGGSLSKIRIVMTKRPPVYTLAIETSGSINIVTWNKAYALFPQFAQIDHADDSFNRLRNNNNRHFEEHSKRDKQFDITYGGIEEEYLELNKWRAISYDGVTTSSLNKSQYSYIYGKRHIGDRQTWTIALDESKVTRPQIFDCEPQNMHFGMCQVYVRDYSDANKRGLIYEDVIVGSWVNHVYHPRNQRLGRQGVEMQRFYGSFEFGGSALRRFP